MITTLQLLSNKLNVPTTTAWYLADLGEARGKQDLFKKQSPQRLRSLREHALIESAVSSNRIEGVTVEQSRLKAVLLAKSPLRDRDEEEIRGYREALDVIHDQHTKLPVSEKTILQLHRLSRANIGDAGRYKKKDSDIIEKLPDGRARVRFRTVPAKETPAAMKQLINAWNDSVDERVVHPAIAMAAMKLDFLCVHPFGDGNAACHVSYSCCSVMRRSPECASLECGDLSSLWSQVKHFEIWTKAATSRRTPRRRPNLCFVVSSPRRAGLR